jgi:DNA-binding response OmpR family regulator
MKRILVVDDEADLRAMLRDMLDSQFEILEAATGREAVQRALQDHPDLILLDISIPELSGIDVCRTLRGHPATAAIPIIMVTAHGSPESKVHGLDTGADDYVVKPFHGGELLARIRARLRETEARDPEALVIGIGNLQINRELREATISDRKVKLTRIECDLLGYFIQRVNRVVERRQLLGELWPDAVVSERTVDTHMANLRKKITGFDHRLDTLHGSGYILRAPGAN